jgi:hypothetical protein
MTPAWLWSSSVALLVQNLVDLLLSPTTRRLLVPLIPLRNSLTVCSPEHDVHQFLYKDFRGPAAELCLSSNSKRSEIAEGYTR